MGTDWYAKQPDDELPDSTEWSHPMMSWRLYGAFTDLLEHLVADLSGLTFDNQGEASAVQARDWAARLRPIASRARRYVRGRISWFEIESDDQQTDSAVGMGVMVREVLFSNSASRDESNAAIEMEDPADTERWITFVADYLEHSGGIDER